MLDREIRCTETIYDYRVSGWRKLDEGQMIFYLQLRGFHEPNHYSLWTNICRHILWCSNIGFWRLQLLLLLLKQEYTYIIIIT